eukprot:gene18221-18473_t
MLAHHGPTCAARRLALYDALPEGWTRSSAGEHLVDIEGVTGSIPVASTIFPARFFEVDVEAIASVPGFSAPDQFIRLQDRQSRRSLGGHVS